jgi:hypothetical protein
LQPQAMAADEDQGAELDELADEADLPLEQLLAK